MLISKRIVLLKILQILQKSSDKDHPLMHDEIVTMLEQNYGIIVERKTIGRSISLLKEAGYSIETGRRGSYIAEREFEDFELKLLIDGILCSKYVNASSSKELIQKICHLSSKHFQSNIQNIHFLDESYKIENSNVFDFIDRIHEAIEKKQQLTFHYNKYGTDKKLHFLKAHKVSPYQILIHNQHYYLMALQEYYQNIFYYRLDYMSELCMLEEKLTDIKTIKGYEEGIHYNKLATFYSYLFTDELKWIIFFAEKAIINDIIEWFGQEACLEEQFGKIKVTVKTSPNAMEFWAMQYLNYVEIIAPLELREVVKENIKMGMQKYNLKES